MNVKVCGLTRAEDAALALSLGAWSLGFIQFSKSPRAVSAEAVRAILEQGRGAARAVGVFVNPALSEVVAFARASGIDTIQLHGDETPGLCAEVRAALPGVEVWKALRPRSRADLALIERYSACDAILLDSYVPGAYGGTGVTGDWELAREAAARGKVILSGGLAPGNVRAAIQAVRPAAIDVASGVESAPGIKSAEKLRRFFEESR